MRWKRLLAVSLAFVLAGCVSTTEFATYKQDIKNDGEAVDAWIAQAHQVIKWVSTNGGTFCPGCAPPAAPPDPPPDGEWGMQ